MQRLEDLLNQTPKEFIMGSKEDVTIFKELEDSFKSHPLDSEQDDVERMVQSSEKVKKELPHEILKRYFAEMPPEVIQADWDEVKDLDYVGPTIEEFLEYNQDLLMDNDVMEEELHYIQPGSMKIIDEDLDIVKDLLNKSKDLVDSEKGSYIEFPEYLLNDPEIVGYPDKEFQDQIYDWVLSKIPNNESILDFGCGRGDINWSRIYDEEGEVSPYYGIDSNEILINVGRKKYELEDLYLECGDFMQTELKKDWSICVGTLNEDRGKDKWSYFNQVLSKMISCSNKGCILVLSRNSDNMEGFLDYPFEELFTHLPSNLAFEIDYSRLVDIYTLVVHIGNQDL